MKKITLGILSLSLLIAACTNTHDKLQSEIKEKEKVLFENQDGKLSTLKAKQ